MGKRECSPEKEGGEVALLRAQLEASELTQAHARPEATSIRRGVRDLHDLIRKYDEGHREMDTQF